MNNSFSHHRSSKDTYQLHFSQWRFDWADDYYDDELDIHTPTFSALTKSGTRFVNTAVCAPICAPSRSCIASGRDFGDNGVDSNRDEYPHDQSTIYKLMQDAGYWVMMAGKDDLTKPHGVDITGDYRQTELGFNDQRRCLGKRGKYNQFYPEANDPYAVYLKSRFHIDEEGRRRSEYDIVHDSMMHLCTEHGCTEPMSISEESYEDNWITQQSLEMMDDIPDGMPWFLQINWAGPHDPFLILESMMETVSNRTFPDPMHRTNNEEDMTLIRPNYAAEIENLDKQMGLVLERVRSMGQYENTVICISSDHGEMLGDFDAFSKHKPWVASTNVPLVCMGPDIERGKIIESYVSNMDLAGTFLDYAGSQKEEKMSTISLRPFLNGTWNEEKNGYREYVTSGMNNGLHENRNWRAVIQDIDESVTWKFICCKGQCPGRSFEERNGLVQLLFNVKEDLYEENDLFVDRQEVADEMRKLLPFGFCTEDSIKIFSERNIALTVMTPLLMALLLFICALRKVTKRRYIMWKSTKSIERVHRKDFVINTGCDETTALLPP